MKIAVGGISHETNSFAPDLTTLKDFRQRGILRGQRLITRNRGIDTAIGGIVDAGSELGWDIIPMVFASAMPGGPVDRATFEALCNELTIGLRRSLPVDAVALAVHGSMLVDPGFSGEAELFRRVRATVGSAIPVAAVLDFHATITDELISLVNVVTGHETNPHTDSHRQGRRSVELLYSVLRRDVHPVTHSIRIPMIAPLPALGAGEDEPMGMVIRHARELSTSDDVVNIVVSGGFPYADSPEAGLAVSVTTNNQHERAKSIAAELARKIWDMRGQFRHSPVSPEDAVRRALDVRRSNWPVILADVADNPGAGAGSQDLSMLRRLLDAGVRSAAIGACYRPDVVRQVRNASAGSTVRFSTGNRPDDVWLEDPATLLGFRRFIETGPVGRGTQTTLGEVAVADVHGIRVIFTDRRVQVTSPAAFRTVGIAPEDCEIVVVKSSLHYRDAFSDLSSTLIPFDSGGIASSHLERLPYRHLKRPIWPLDENAEFPAL